MLVLFYAQRVFVYQRSAFTHGMMVCDNLEDRKLYDADMTLHYYVEGKEYTTQLRGDTRLAYKELCVRYPKTNVEKGRIYSIGKFWFFPLLWLLFPLMLWGGFVFTKFRENSGVNITIERKCNN